jgi:putative transposase
MATGRSQMACEGREGELLDRERFRTPAEARRAVFEYVEGWYNPQRRHPALGYESPLRYERIHAPGPLMPMSAENSTAALPLGPTIAQGGVISLSPPKWPCHRSYQPW